MSSPQQRQQPAPEDVIGCQAALFEWAESFDTKDWDRLRSNLAPTLRVDYRHVMGQMWEAMPADEFVALASNPRFLGDARLRTQHFVGGASRWEQTAAGRVTGRHQVRVAHQRYADDALKESATAWFEKVDGVWKFAGICPDIRWSEYNYDEMFKHE
ncbi:scytalone dehydratase [Apiospora saccharicola]